MSSEDHERYEERELIDEAVVNSRKEDDTIEIKVETYKEIPNAEAESFLYLLKRVNEKAHSIIKKSREFRDKFLKNYSCKVFVLSMDIRRSTELMLKARTPEDFALFITTLCENLINIVKKNYGVVDKFTGDGILAFFPDFFSGEDAGYYAIYTAALCHQAFEETYEIFRSSFISILKDAGLGIGIDFGVAHLIQMADGISVVGVPVVYACRMSGAKAGVTLLNQPAYEVVRDRFSKYFYISESEIEIKHEGFTLACKVKPSNKSYDPQPPSWMDDQQNT